MRCPVIGVTPAYDEQARSYRLDEAYVRSVLAAGGMPLMLPYPPDEGQRAAALAAVDGLLLSGGHDVDPAQFGAEPHRRLGTITPTRDAAELSWVRQGLATGLPMLGICRGAQAICVAAGGTLYQDLAEEFPARTIKHRQEAPRAYPTHAVSLAPGSRLAGLLGPGSIRVNSFHHQAVKTPPAGFAVTATAPDGVIEAIEAGEYRFCVGVQWHPECMWREGTFLPLFRALIEACR